MSTNIPELNALYDRLLGTDVNPLSNDDAIKIVGTLIDLSDDLGRSEGIERALEICDHTEARRIDEVDTALLQYFRANAWAARRHQEKPDVWDWEQPLMAKQIYYLRKCVGHPGFKQLQEIRRCQVFTNLGNCLSTVGRFVDALEYWEHAITLHPRFGMALGNKGHGLEQYARSLYDPGHQMLFAKFAHINLVAATQTDAEYDGSCPHAIAQFEGLKSKIETLIPGVDDIEIHPHGMGKSKAEQAYRAWCIRNRLFLNPLNDLGEHSIANQDVLLMPSFSTKVNEPPLLIGFFNQIKQEYASARWLLYEGLVSDSVHFSDRNVPLYNTLDYPCHSLGLRPAEEVPSEMLCGEELSRDA